MSRLTKAAGYGVLTIAVVLAAAITATIGWRPFIGARARPLTDRKFEPTAARLERGAYLVNNVNGCLYCHSELDVTKPGIITAGTEGAGHVWAPEAMPWLTAPNLTPDPETGSGTWSDDVFARAIREGIGHDGRTLFPMMPYRNFREMSDEDLASVVTFIRTLKPVRRALPLTAVPFPVNRLINGVPQPVEAPVASPDLSNQAVRGKYMITMAGCADCHTTQDAQGTAVPGMAFAGGTMLTTEGMPNAASQNLTPASNGIPYYTEALFLETIRTGRVRERQLSEHMPWRAYRGMIDDDLKAIFGYLKTLTPVEHYVDNAMPPTACARCGLQHGGGERNARKS